MIPGDIQNQKPMKLNVSKSHIIKLKANRLVHFYNIGETQSIYTFENFFQQNPVSSHQKVYLHSVLLLDIQ